MCYIASHNDYIIIEGPKQKYMALISLQTANTFHEDKTYITKLEVEIKCI